jgi:hypothetical protein
MPSSVRRGVRRFVKEQCGNDVHSKPGPGIGRLAEKLKLRNDLLSQRLEYVVALDSVELLENHAWQEVLVAKTGWSIVLGDWNDAKRFVAGRDPGGPCHVA